MSKPQTTTPLECFALVLLREGQTRWKGPVMHNRARSGRLVHRMSVKAFYIVIFFYQALLSLRKVVFAYGISFVELKVVAIFVNQHTRVFCKSFSEFNQCWYLLYIADPPQDERDHGKPSILLWFEGIGSQIHSRVNWEGDWKGNIQYLPTSKCVYPEG